MSQSTDPFDYTDCNGVWPGSMIDKAARWLRDRNGPGEGARRRGAGPGGGSDHCRVHPEGLEKCHNCRQQRWRAANRETFNAKRRAAYAKQRGRDARA